MKFKLLFLILFSFTIFTLNVILSVVLSDTVEITIGYETTTTTTTTISGVTTTTPSGSPSGPGGTTTTIKIPEKIEPGAVLIYSLPASYELYQNETGSFVIKVINNGTKILHSINVGVSGIPINSYSVSPDSVVFLELGKSTAFTFSINPQNITPNTYTATVTIVSNETYETTHLILKINPFTREIAEIIEKQEEFEKVTKPALISIKNLLIGAITTCSIIAAVMLILLKKNRCPLCGGKVEKEYEGDNFISYKCSKCTYYKDTVRKK